MGLEGNRNYRRAARPQQDPKVTPLTGSRTRRGSGVSLRPRSSAVEHFLGKEEVIGSSPIVGSIVLQVWWSFQQQLKLTTNRPSAGTAN